MISSPDASQSTNSGEPTCPPWCADHHPEMDIHRTARAEVSFNKAMHPAYGEVHGIEFSHEPAQVSFYARHHDVDAQVVREFGQYVSPDEALQLAGLIEILSRATPEQHRELAAAIRKAAADIVGGGNA